MKKSTLILFLASLLLLGACEKVINVDLKNAEPRIVIEGMVSNNGDSARVQISRSVPFSNNNSYPPVSGAAVRITDNAGNSYTLTEKSPGQYTNALLRGIPGRNYTLSVTAEGKNYTANSTMPQPVGLDSLIQDSIILNKSIIFVSALFTDPPGFGNNYHFVETINGKRNKTIFLINDDFTDGSDFANQLIDEDAQLKAGDLVEIEMQCIDKNAYRYLRGLQDLQFNNTVPANPETNISNNALGYFSARCVERKSIRIR